MIKERLLFLPGNPRYQPKELKPYFGYDELYREVARVELATLDTLHDIGVIPIHEYNLIQPATIDQILDISTT